jgi:hypothetical protein
VDDSIIICLGSQIICQVDDASLVQWFLGTVRIVFDSEEFIQNISPGIAITARDGEAWHDLDRFFFKARKH